MKCISAAEFGDLYADDESKQFIINSGNQKDLYTDINIEMSAKYDSVYVNTNPVSITFFNRGDRGNYVRFNRVKHVMMHECGKMAGTIFDIICGGKIDHGDDRVYTLLVD